MSNKLLWNVSSSLINAVPHYNKNDQDKDKYKFSVSGTDWDNIGILSDIFDSNENIKTDNELPVEEPNDTVGIDEIIDTYVLINSNLNEDNQDNKTAIRNDNVTIGLAGYCSQKVTIKKLPLFTKYKADRHSYNLDLFKK